MIWPKFCNEWQGMLHSCFMLGVTIVGSVTVGLHEVHAQPLQLLNEDKLIFLKPHIIAASVIYY